MTSNDELEPCPFCGAGETRFDDNNYWTGMNNRLVSVILRHWCSDHMMTTIRTTTKEQCIAVWNRRSKQETQ